MIKKSLHESFHIIEAGVYNNTLINREFTEFDEMNFDGKTLVIFCGNTTKNPMKALSYAGNALNWLSDMPNADKIRVYSIFYPGDQPLFSNFAIDPTFDYRRLSRKIFKKIATKNGQYLSPEQICKNLDNVVFFGHSVGGMIMDSVVDQLQLSLQFNEFSPYEIRKIMSHIVFVGYAPFEVVDRPINAVYITPLYDSLGSPRLALEKMLRKDRGGFVTNNKNVEFAREYAHKIIPYTAYFDKYQALFGNKTVTYLASKKTITAIPNLLFYDGIKEDHNLAGVIEYRSPNPYKTDAGIETTKFMHQALRYCFEKDRQKFDGRELFIIATQNQSKDESNKNQVTIEK